ncbi:MAG: hypothetical protein RRA15_07730 [bacterium]|nr:hypothetical protein [bacterium]MDT8366367.1 hypothetical protein [bacterium]
MTYRYLIIFTIILVLFPAGCSYRFVDPFPAYEYALVSVRNFTAEAGLAVLLEEEMRKLGGFKEHSASRLSVTVTGFTESVDSISSSGFPVRQKLTIDVAWKVEGKQSAQAVFGSETASLIYPWSTNLSTLDWNRSAAVRLLTETAASRILADLGEQP